MSLRDVLGQKTAVGTLCRALERKQVHHAYRFEGPEGVGKMLCARAFAQALLCEHPEQLGCGNCRACELARGVSEEPPHLPKHPDILIVERGLYPPSALGKSTEETTSISVQQVRKIVLPRVGYAPHEGRALCIIVNRAEELSVSAANALLKTLEEPPPKTHFMLLTSRPGKLLDTVRSRTLAIRFAPLPAELVHRLGKSFGVTEDVARLAEGSVSRAIELSDADKQERRRAFVQAALDAIKAPDLVLALAFANQRSEDRGELGQELGSLAQAFADEARRALLSTSRAPFPWAEGHRIVLGALDAVDHNAQPGLTLEAMIAKLRTL